MVMAVGRAGQQGRSEKPPLTVNQQVLPHAATLRHVLQKRVNRLALELDHLLDELHQLVVGSRNEHGWKWTKATLG